jgi:mannosyltransferase
LTGTTARRWLDDDRVVLWLLAGLALAVRLPGAFGDLWLDEVATLLGSVRPPLAEIVSTYNSPNAHVLYSVLAHLVVTVAGEHAWAVRLPALLFGAATVPALYYLATRWFARREALAAALILALSYHHAYFSQNARGYTGLLFFSVLSTAWLAQALTTGRRRYWIGYAVITGLNVYMLLSAVFVCVWQVVGAVIVYVLPGSAAGRRGARLGDLALWTAAAAALTIALYLPLLPDMIAFFTGTTGGAIGWKPSLALVQVMLRDAVPSQLALMAVLGVLLAPVGIAGFVSVLRRAPITFFALVLPPTAEVAVGLLMGAGTYPRRFLSVLPFAILVAVRGAAVTAEWLAARRRRPALAGPVFAAATAVVALAAAVGLPRLWTTPKQDYRGALAYVAEHRRPGDIVAAAWVADLGAMYYDSTVVSVRNRAALERELARGRPVWLLGTLPGDIRRARPALAALIRERFAERARFRGLVGDGGIVVWRGCLAGAAACGT